MISSSYDLFLMCTGNVREGPVPCCYNLRLYSFMVCRLQRIAKFACWNGILFMKQWQAVVYPLSLTSLMYAGSLVLKFMFIVSSWKEYRNQGRGITINCVKDVPQNFFDWVFSTASNIMAWRNYVVVSIFTIYFFIGSILTMLP